MRRRERVRPYGRGTVVLHACLAGLSAACGREPSAEPVLSSVVEMPSPASPGSAEPNLAVGPDGVYLSWLEPAGSGHALRFAVLRGERWSEPGTIARGERWFVNWADFPSLLALPGGHLVAHYLERDPDADRGYQYGVRVVQSTDGGRRWGAPVTPHRDDVPAEHGFVSLFAGAGDSLAMVWLDGRKADPRYGGRHETALRSTTLLRDGTLGADRAVDERVCDCCQTAAANTAQGPLVVYRDRTEGEIRDIYVARLVNGSWTAPQPVHRDGWKINACPVNGPAVGATGERVAVAWFTAAGDTARVLVAFSDNAGAAFAPPIRVDSGDPAGRVDVELLPEGRALVSWIENAGEAGAEVRARLVSADGTMGEPIRIAASSGERASGFPRMARDGERIVLAWTEPGKPSRVRVARAELGSDR